MHLLWWTKWSFKQTNGPVYKVGAHAIRVCAFFPLKHPAPTYNTPAAALSFALALRLAKQGLVLF